MKTLFDEDGHLTGYAIKRLCQADLDELAALEAAEHLAYCDRCLLKYTSALEKTTLMSPQRSIATEVLAKIRQETRRLFFNRYATVAVAACLAMAFWIGGVFTPQVTPEESEIWQTVAESTAALQESTQELSQRISGNLSRFFQDISSFDLKGVFEHEEK